MRQDYKYEFPNFDFDIPSIEGFKDNSWHNDVCPSFVRQLSETHEMVLWVNYLEEDRRECGGRQFTLIVKEIGNDEDPFNFESELETNSWDEILNKISSLTKGQMV
jgi:hypothetical protein